MNKANTEQENPNTTKEEPMTSETTTETRVRPRRPRRKLNSPINLALAALLIAGLSFWAGSRSGGDDAASAPAAFPAMAEAPGGSAGSAVPGQMPGATSGSGTSGEVTSLKGNVLYVQTGEGTTVKVKVGEDASVTRTAETRAQEIRPGDTVTVDGKTAGSGAVEADSVTAIGSGASPVMPSGAMGSPAAE